ncbi:MAG: GNAT family N-acyltransferase [Pseudomonadota bacterium]
MVSPEQQWIKNDIEHSHQPLLSAGHYRLSLAASADDLRRICALRFAVFNLELDEGLSSSYETGEDRDEFDAHCDHLMVEDARTGAIVGTYRLQDRRMAANGAGFYSANEYELEQLGDTILDSAIELGRACIDIEHRNTRVLFLLWKGMARYMTERGHRFFFGCCSLTSTDPAEGQALFRRLREQGACDPDVHVAVRPAYHCEEKAWPEARALPRVPKLMRLYLSYGAKIVSGPALDREFSTIDYLALFDIHSLSDQARRMFLDG